MDVMVIPTSSSPGWRISPVETAPSPLMSFMAKKSAGLLMYRLRAGCLEVLLVHSGGPYWVNRHWHAWSIPKGEIDPGEDAFAAAKREFQEETGHPAQGQFNPLQPVRQASGKLVFAWAFEGDFDPAQLHSITFHVEWPPRSGKLQEFPEVDRTAWFPWRRPSGASLKPRPNF
jgi:predicted NUDIX family NTP pyrophosphohydrolase